MPSISLATYRIAVGKKGSPHLYDLFDLPGNRKLPEEIYSFLDQKEQYEALADNSQEYFRVLPGKKQVAASKPARVQVYGRVACSYYGQKYEIAHVQDPSKAVVQTKQHAREDPYFYFFDFRKGDPWGIMVLQRTGGHGVMGAMRRHLVEYIDTRFDKALSLRISQEVPKKVVADALTGGVKVLRLTQHKIPSDLADRFSLKGYEENIQEVEIRVKAKKNKLLPLSGSIAKVANGHAVNDLVSIDVFNPDDAKVTVSIGDKDRVVRVSEEGPEVQAYWDVSKEVDRDSDGHPLVGDLLRESKSLAEMIWNTRSSPE